MMNFDKNRGLSPIVVCPLSWSVPYYSIIRVQTVTTRADGVTPIPSEAAAAARIQAAYPNDQLIIVPKRKP
jgi:hypothetical protein